MVQGEKEDIRIKFSRLRNYIRQPHIIISLVLLLLLLFIVLIPFIKMVKDSFIWHFGDTRLSRSARPGSFTIFHWRRILASQITRNVLLRPAVERERLIQTRGRVKHQIDVAYQTAGVDRARAG